MKRIIYSSIALIMLMPFFCSCTEETGKAEGPKVPELISVIPVAGPSGSTIIISGLNFSTVIEENVVTIGGKQAVVKSATERKLTVTAPENEDGVAEVKVTVKGTELEGFTFTYSKLIDPEIVIGSISPAQAYVGDEVTIFGENFSDDKKEVKVKFGETEAQIISCTETSITVTAPQNALGDIVVEVTSKSKKASAPFRYVDLIFTGNRPTEGGEGTIVTITGDGFNPDPAQNKVTVNGIELVPTEATLNTLSIIMPTLPFGTYEFTVETHGKSVKGGSFTVAQVWTVETLAGSVAGHKDGIGKEAQFQNLQDVVLAENGLLWITQRGGAGKDAIRSLDPKTNEIKTLVNTDNTTISGGHPWGSCFDKHGNYWFVLKAVGKDNIIKVAKGTTTPEVVKVEGRTLASNTMYILVDDNDNLYILNRGNTSYISVYDKGLNKLNDYPVTGLIEAMAWNADKSGIILGRHSKAGADLIMFNPADGSCTPIAGKGVDPTASTYTDGEAGKPLTAVIGVIEGIAVDKEGTIWFSDQKANTLRKLIPGEGGDYTKGTVKTVAGTAMSSGSVDGKGTNAKFNLITGLCFMPDGSLIVVEAGRFIRRVYSN